LVAIYSGGRGFFAVSADALYATFAPGKRPMKAFVSTPVRVLK
jgi:hypothetical protein